MCVSHLESLTAVMEAKLKAMAQSSSLRDVDDDVFPREIAEKRADRAK